MKNADFIFLLVINEKKRIFWTLHFRIYLRFDMRIIWAVFQGFLIMLN